MSAHLREVNIKADMPTASDAVKRVTFYLRNSKAQGYTAVKFIHGYGSHGVGGKIRTQVRSYLMRQKDQRMIKDFIPGESFSIFDQATRDAFLVCDQLRRDSDLDRHNNGVTIVIL